MDRLVERAGILSHERMRHDTYYPLIRRGPRPAPPSGHVFRVLAGTAAAVALLAAPPAATALAFGALIGWFRRRTARRLAILVGGRMRRAATRTTRDRRSRIARWVD